MDEAASKPEPGFCELNLRRIDEALSSTAGAMLSLEEFDQVTALRRRLRALCEAGDEAEAQKVVSAAMEILRPRARRRI